jgi:glutaredoxin-related protein
MTPQELPLVYVGGQFVGGVEAVNAKVADGSLKKTVAELRQVRMEEEQGEGG